MFDKRCFSFIINETVLVFILQKLVLCSHVAINCIRSVQVQAVRQFPSSWAVCAAGKARMVPLLMLHSHSALSLLTISGPGVLSLEWVSQMSSDRWGPEARLCRPERDNSRDSSRTLELPLSVTTPAISIVVSFKSYVICFVIFFVRTDRNKIHYGAISNKPLNPKRK